MMLPTEFIGASDSKSRRLMIMLHGLGDSLEGYRWFPEAMRLPGMNYLLVNAPNQYYDGWSWFDLENMAPGIKLSRRLIFDVIDEWVGKGFTADQITLGGFSQGCLMTIDVGLRYPQRFAGLVGISGWVFEPEKLVQELTPIGRSQRLICTHGPYDSLLPIDNTRAQLDLLETAGVTVEWNEFPKAHTIHGEEELAVIREFVRAGYPDVGK